MLPIQKKSMINYLFFILLITLLDYNLNFCNKQININC